MKKYLFVPIILSVVTIADLTWRCLADYAFSYEVTDGVTPYSYHTFSKSTDILVLGASRARYHINSDMIRDSLNMCCYNLGMDACGLYQQYASLKTCLKNGPCKLVILELSPLQLGNPINAEKTNITYFTPYYWKDAKLREVMNGTYGKDECFKYVSSFAQFNGLLLEVLVKLKHRNDRFHDDDSGFVEMVDNDKNSKSFVPDTLSDINIHPISLKLLDEMVDICKNNNIRMIVVVSPTIDNCDIYVNWLSGFCLKNDVEFYDCSKASFDLENSTYFHDNTHLNGSGAYLFTKQLINIIR